jgi:hypothetical protein
MTAAMELQRQKFYHPYSPYEIQLQFMKALYECIESGKIGIFESPTGEFQARMVKMLVEWFSNSSPQVLYVRPLVCPAGIDSSFLRR